MDWRKHSKSMVHQSKSKATKQQRKVQTMKKRENTIIYNVSFLILVTWVYSVYQNNNSCLLINNFGNVLGGLVAT